MRSKKEYESILAELHFMPSLYYITWMTRYDSLVMVEQHENYNKGSFRNKCIVSGNQMNQYLIIPLKKGKHQSQPIRDVEISYDEDWIRVMKNKLQTEYGNYPYYLYYIDDIIQILDKKHTFLFDLNTLLLDYIFRLIDLHEYIFTNEYKTGYHTGVLDIRDRIYPGFFNTHTDLLQPMKAGYFSFIPGHSIFEALFSYGPELPLLVGQYNEVLTTDPFQYTL